MSSRLIPPVLSLVLTVVLVSPVAAQPPSLPAESLKRIKAATVYVAVKGPEHRGTGSGFLVKADGSTGWVVTNDHVVTGPRFGLACEFAKDSVTLVFHSGTKDEWSAAADVIARDSERDLAVLRVKTPKPLPEPLPIATPVKLTETMPVYVCGFPFGELLAAGAKNPEISIGPASVSSIRANEAGEVVTVQLNGALNPGNSGGPVVAADGTLVGVAVRTVRGAGIGEAIPRRAVVELLLGRVGSVDLVQTVGWAKERSAGLVGQIADPSGKVGSVRGHIAPAVAPAAPPADVAKLPKAVTVALKPVDRSVGVVFERVTVPAGAARVWVQAEWTEAGGRVHRGTPRLVEVKTATDILIEQEDALRDLLKLLEPAPDRPLPLRGRDPGLAGLVSTTGRQLPPVATRLPESTPGTLTASYVGNHAQSLVGKPVTFDVVTSDVKVERRAEGGWVMSGYDERDNPTRKNILLDEALADGFRRMGVAGRWVAVRLRGLVLSDPNARGQIVRADELGMLAIDGTVLTRLKRLGEDVSARAADDGKLLDVFQHQPDHNIGGTFSLRVMTTGVTAADAADTQAWWDVQQLTTWDLGFRKPLPMIRVFVAKELASRIAQKTTADRRRHWYAEVSFRVAGVNPDTRAVLAAATEVKLFDDDWTTVAWEGKGPAPDLPRPRSAKKDAADFNARQWTAITRSPSKKGGTAHTGFEAVFDGADEYEISGPGGTWRVRRLHVKDVSGAAVPGVVLCVTDAIADQLAAARKAHPGAVNLRLAFRSVWRDTQTQYLICPVQTVELYDAEFRNPLWRGHVTFDTAFVQFQAANSGWIGPSAGPRDAEPSATGTPVLLVFGVAGVAIVLAVAGYTAWVVFAGQRSRTPAPKTGRGGRRSVVDPDDEDDGPRRPARRPR